MTEQPAWPEYANLTKPDISLLKQILEDDTFHIKYTDGQFKAVQLKYQSMTADTNTIEKTMSPAQLYAINHPCWAQSHTINELYKYIQCKHNCTDYDDVLLFISDFQITF